MPRNPTAAQRAASARNLQAARLARKRGRSGLTFKSNAEKSAGLRRKASNAQRRSTVAYSKHDKGKGAKAEAKSYALHSAAHTQAIKALTGKTTTKLSGTPMGTPRTKSQLRADKARDTSWQKKNYGRVTDTGRAQARPVKAHAGKRVQ